MVVPWCLVPPDISCEAEGPADELNEYFVC